MEQADHSQPHWSELARKVHLGHRPTLGPRAHGIRAAGSPVDHGGGWQAGQRIHPCRTWWPPDRPAPGETPATTLQWQIPARLNALERNRARAYHIAYCGMVAYTFLLKAFEY